MKLIRFGMPGEEKPGVIINENYFDVSSYVKDYDEQFFADDGLQYLKEITSDAELTSVDNNIRLGSAVARPSKIICIGLNYSDHAAESKMQVPPEPVIFLNPQRRCAVPMMMLSFPETVQKQIGKWSWLLSSVKRQVI